MELITINHAVRLIGISRQRLDVLIREGTLDCVEIDAGPDAKRVSRALRRADVVEYAEARRHKMTAREMRRAHETRSPYMPR